MLTTNAVQHKNHFPTEAEEFPSLQVFRTSINKPRLDLLLVIVLLQVQGWTTEVFSSQQFH